MTLVLRLFQKVWIGIIAASVVAGCDQAQEDPDSTFKPHALEGSEITFGTLADLKAGALDRGAYPRFRVQHQFPREARVEGISGCVIYSFTITGTGAAEDIVVTGSTSELFEEYGERAIAQWEYEPIIANGEPIATPHQTVRLIWEVEGVQIPDHPVCDFENK